jgi:hypothetical protein
LKPWYQDIDDAMASGVAVPQDRTSRQAELVSPLLSLPAM